MNPPVFATVKNNAAVQAAFGASPVRVYPFGQAPDKPVDPYCVWRISAGTPENFINQRPDIDAYTVQFDVYGLTAASVEAGARALRDALEGACHITSWLGTDREASTGRYSYRFLADWWVPRS